MESRQKSKELFCRSYCVESCGSMLLDCICPIIRNFRKLRGTCGVFYLVFPSIFLESKGLALGLASLKPVALKVGEKCGTQK